MGTSVTVCRTVAADPANELAKLPLVVEDESASLVQVLESFVGQGSQQGDLLFFLAGTLFQ